MNKRTLIILVGIMFFMSGSNLSAISPKAALSFVKLVGKKLGLKIAQSGKYASKLIDLSKKHGDDLVKSAFKRSGPKALSIAEKYGDDGLKAVSKYGDDAVKLISNGGGKETISLISKYGDDAIAVITKNPGSGRYALKNLGAEATKLSTQNIVRATAYHKDAVINGFGSQFKIHFKKYGKKFLEFVKRHKGKFAIAGIYGAIKLNPEGELVPGLPNKKMGHTVSKFLDYSLYGSSAFVFILLLLFLRQKKRIHDFEYKKLEPELNKKVDRKNEKK